MDLITQKQGVWILHMIDAFSRYSVACVRRSRKPESITDAILKTWISYFGQSRRFLEENGGEFFSDEYKQTCEQFNLKMSRNSS